ncbi:MAG TPA: hypothetical protein VM899_10135 [Rubellimicrobium sp.]|nr:hypothetical protein [Rubellimicrobium sp.]
MAPPHPRLRLHSRAEFIRRLSGFVLFGLAFLLLSLGIGVLGYHHLAGLSWIDSWYNAAMILTGMGPASAMPSDAAKIFASAYAIFSGAVYPAVTAIVLYPLVHRMMAVLHVEAQVGQGEDAA